MQVGSCPRAVGRSHRDRRCGSRADRGSRHPPDGPAAGRAPHTPPARSSGRLDDESARVHPDRHEPLRASAEPRPVGHGLQRLGELCAGPRGCRQAIRGEHDPSLLVLRHRARVGGVGRWVSERICAQGGRGVMEEKWQRLDRRRSPARTGSVRTPLRVVPSAPAEGMAMGLHGLEARTDRHDLRVRSRRRAPRACCRHLSFYSVDSPFGPQGPRLVGNVMARR